MNSESVVFTLMGFPGTRPTACRSFQRRKPMRRVGYGASPKATATHLLSITWQDDRYEFVSKCGLHVSQSTLIEERGRGKCGVEIESNGMVFASARWLRQTSSTFMAELF
jgi:hypothetical protein